MPTTNLVHASSARRAASGLRYRPAWHTGTERGVVIYQTGSKPRGATDSPRSAPQCVWDDSASGHVAVSYIRYQGAAPRGRKPQATRVPFPCPYMKRCGSMLHVAAPCIFRPPAYRPFSPLRSAFPPPRIRLSVPGRTPAPCFTLGAPYQPGAARQKNSVTNTGPTTGCPRCFQN